MKFRYFTFLIILLSWNSANASPEQFMGTWGGQGTYIFNGEMTQCSEFRMEFEATENTFTFASGNRVCDKHSEEFYRVTMSYSGGVLYFNGQVVGSYDGNTLEAQFRAPDGDSFRNWRMLMRRQGNHVMYEESRRMDGDDTPLISFAGLMILQQ